MVTATDTQEARYLALADRIGANPDAPPWLAALRSEAAARFRVLGFPVARRGNEFWKYTDVGPIARATPEPATAQGSEAPRVTPVADGEVRVSVVDGFVAPAPRALDGGYVGSLQAAPSAVADVAAARLGSIASFEHEAFAALNTALMQDVTLIYAQRGASLGAHVHVVLASSPDTASQPRVLIIAEEDADASIALTWAGAGAGSFSNAVVEVAAAAGASVRLLRIAHPATGAHSIATTAVAQQRGSSVELFSLDLGGKLVRHNLDVSLSEPDAACSLGGLYLTARGDHVDNHVLVAHRGGEATSNALYKGVAAGGSRAVFTGQVHVPQDSQRTETHLVNKNVLLAPDAEVNSQPKLEIYADDIIATHGSAVGQIDAAALFYMRSRGLDADAARMLLLQAFVDEPIAAIGDAAHGAAVARLAAEALRERTMGEG